MVGRSGVGGMGLHGLVVGAGRAITRKTPLTFTLNLGLQLCSLLVPAGKTIHPFGPGFLSLSGLTLSLPQTPLIKLVCEGED